MPSQSPTRSDIDRSSDVEKIESLHSRSSDRASVEDPEKKQELRRKASRSSNTQAIPGLRLDDEDDEIEPASEHDDASSSEEKQSGRLSNVVSRVLSRTTSKSSWNPGPPPDGGLKAWTAVLCAHLIIMNTWGYINSFGIFQTYYATSLKLPPSTISWIGSIQIFLLFFIGTFTGRLTDAGYFRQVFLLGSAFQIIGIFTTSVCTQYWQLFLAQGICMGLGNGCLFCPALATVSTYFTKKRGIALGITACGSVTGGLIFPVMARQMLPSSGFPWTIRAIGFIQLAGLVVANALMRTRIQPRRSGAIVEWAAWRELEYTFYALGSFFCFMGLYFAFFYVASFSRDIIGMEYTESLNLLLLMNGVGSFGRLVPNHIADRIGPINVFVPVGVLGGVTLICWIAVTNPAGTYAWACCYGIAGGGIQSLFPAGLSSLTTDLRKSGVRMGMVFTTNSFATLIGPPIAGAIISASNGKYYGAQAFAGGTMLLGTGFLVAARIARMRKLNRGWLVNV